jgi:Lambda phage tail tube protein, TTP
MGVRAVSSHGIIIEHQPAATPGIFTAVPEVGDIDNLGTLRNTFDVSVHNEDIDTHVLGIMRRENFSFPMNWVADDTVHQAMLDSHFAGDVDGWRVTFPDGDLMIFSGGVSNFGRPGPVDGAMRANITIRPSGLYIWNSETVGL